MTEWTEVRLGEVAEVLVGFAFKSSDFTRNGNDLRLLRGVNIGQGELDWSQIERLPARLLHDERYRLAEGDIVLAMDRPWIEAGLKRARLRADDLPAVLVQRVARLRGKGSARTSFINGILATDAFSAYLRNIATGVTVPHVSQSQIESFRFRIPPPSVQTSIGQFLDALDDLIVNNRSRAKVLEAMARAIYREWFVHFRYPGHEDIPLVDSSLGPIPDGWVYHRLSEVAQLVRGRSYRKSELVVEGGLPFVNLKCMMRGGGFRRDGLKRYEGRFTEAQVVGHGDVVLAVTDLTQEREILARATLVPRLPEPKAVISLDVARIVPLRAADRPWIFAALRWSDFSGRVKEHANGSTVLHLAPEHVAAGLVLWPPDNLRTAFIDALMPMLEAMDELVDASDRLTSIRDLLLPKLVTGQIDVSRLQLSALAAVATA